MKITEVFLLFLVARFCLCNEDFCRETTGPILYNRVLIGHVIKSLLTRGIFSCAHKCLSVSFCSSYNYQTSAAQDGVCELNGESEGDHPEQLTEKHGFAFARIRQEKKPRSCLEAWEKGARTSGFFCIQGNDGHLHKMYCDLASEPGWAWTLVMSQELRNREEQFTQDGLMVDSPINREMANWQAYRLPLSKMEILRNSSTHWRIICNFPLAGVDFRDYVRAEFSQFDLVTFVAARACKKVEYMDVRGHACQQCTAAWGQKANSILTHRSDVNDCERGPTPDHVRGEQSFGRYKKGLNPEFRCTAGNSSTTNYWFGRKVKP